MRKILILLILINISFSAHAVNLDTLTTVPKYLWVDFQPEEYIPGDVHKMINTWGLKKVYTPPRKIEEHKAFKLRAPKVNKDGVTMVHISNNPGAQTETWVTVNPTDNNNVIATCNDNLTNGNGGQYKMSSYFTRDGGKTWDFAVTDNHNSNNVFVGGRTIFDPVIAFNHLGDVFYGYGYTKILDRKTEGQNGIFGSMSGDGGETWTNFDEQDVYVVAEADGGDDGFHDRYSIAADLWSDDYKGNIYIAWRFFRDGKGIEFAASGLDEEYYDWYDESITSFESTQAPVPAVGPNGEVYVTWRQTPNPDRTQAPVVVSYDGGRTFEDHSVAMENWNIGALRENLPSYARVSLPTKDSMRISTNPVISVDPSNGPRRGWVYIVQPGKEGGRTGPTRMYCAVLRDPSGTNWETIRIDNNEHGNDMFLPSITVDPVTGYVYVLYYSSQEDPDNVLVDAYLAYSYDGLNFKHKRLSDESFLVKAQGQSEEGNRYWGDYTSVAAYDNKAYPVWWMPVAESGSHGTLDLFTALISSAPAAPEIGVENGESVTISWSDIVDGLGEPVNEYTIRVYKNDVLVNEFEQATTSYIDSEVNPGDEIKYGVQIISKDVRGEGEIGEVNVVVGGELEPLAPTNFSANPIAEGIRFTWTNPTETIDGAGFETISAIKIYQNGNLLATVENAVQDAGSDAEFVWETNTEQFYDGIYITAVRQRGNDEAESVPSESLIAYAGSPLTSLDEGFENESEIVPHYTTDTWGVSDKGGYESSFSLTDSPDGEYDREANTWVMFAPVVASDSNPWLVFDHISIIDDRDYAGIDISLDGGKTWETVFSTNELYAEGSFGDSFEESNWVQAGVNLLESGAESGDIVFFRATMKSFSIRREDGVYFDNIKLTNPDGLRDGNVVSVEEMRSSHLSVIASPNPAEQNTTVTFANKYSSNITLEVFDNLGNRVSMEFTKEFTPGTHTHELDLSSFASGIYYVRISDAYSAQTATINVRK